MKQWEKKIHFRAQPERCRKYTLHQRKFQMKLPNRISYKKACDRILQLLFDGFLAAMRIFGIVINVIFQP